MPTLDWIFLGAVLASLALGAWRGLTYEVLSVLSWVAAFVLAQWYAPDVAHSLPMAGSGEAFRYAAGFALVFVAVVFAGGLFAVLFRKLFAVVGLRPADRVLGAVFGTLRGVVLLLAAAVVIGMTPMRTSEWWQQSLGAGMCLATLKELKPVMPQDFGKYLP